MKVAIWALVSLATLAGCDDKGGVSRGETGGLSRAIT